MSARVPGDVTSDRVPVAAAATPIPPVTPAPPAATGGHATLISISAGTVGVLSYAANLTMTHLLAPGSYTSFAAAAGLVATAGIASVALIPMPLAHVVRAHPSGSSTRRDAMTFAVGVSALVGVVAGLVVGLLTTGFAPIPVALAAGASALALFGIAPVWGTMQGEGRFLRYAVLTVAEVAVRLVVGVLAVLLGAGAWGAVAGFGVGALAVLLGVGRLRDVNLPSLGRVLGQSRRWAETGGVAAVQAVLSVLSVADLVTVAATVPDAVEAGGYQALATLAKAPVYVAVGTSLVSFPALRALVTTRGAAHDRDRLLRDALTSFVRLVVPAAVGVATVPTVLVGLVLPAAYLPATALLGWLALAGIGVGASTVLAMLLLAVRARGALAGGLVVAVVTFGAGLGAGLADGTVPGFARWVAVGAVAGALGMVACGWRRRPAGLGWSAARGGLWAVVVLGVLTVTHDVPVVWLIAAALVGVAAIAVPVLAGRLRASAQHDEDTTGPATGGLHVLHLGLEDPAMPGAGGGAVRTREIGRRLAAAGHRITVVVARYPGCVDRTEHHGSGSVRWIHPGIGAGRTRLGRFAGYLVGTVCAVRSVPADLVVEDFLAPISSMGVPWFSPHPTVGVVQWLNAREKARQYRVPVHWVERIAVRSHHHVITVSRGVAEQVAALSPRTATTVVGNGVEPACFAAAGTPTGDDVVYVGRLEIAQKGLDLLVDAWARLAPRVGGRLVLAGTGSDEDALRARVDRHGIADRVHFAGWTAGEDKARLLAGARVVAVPSRFETFGIVGAEAVATGSVVVIFDIACLREVVPPEVGVHVPMTGDHDRDAAALADALGHAHADEGLQARAAAEGPRLAAVHDWDALALAQERIYRAEAGVS